MSQDARGLKSKAFLISLGTLTSRTLGLLRDMAMAALFDRQVTDAWTVAFRIPNLFRRLFGEGSLSVSFIPLFIDLRVQDSTGTRARNLVNGFYALLLLFLSVLSIWGLLFMEPLLKLLLDPTYYNNPEKFALTLKMAQIMFGFIFFVVSYAYFTGILQALGEFKWPALAPALFNIVLLLFTFLPAHWFPTNGENLAWGVLVGGIFQSLILLPVLKNKNYFPKVLWQGFNQDLKRLLLRMIPGVLGLGLVQLLTLVNLSFASGMEDGVVSAIYWADRLLELPLSLVAVSLSAALLPQLSELWSRHDRARMQELQNQQLVVNGFWAVPSAAGLYFLAAPIVEVLFMRGQFSEADLMRTVDVLQIYALSLLVLSVSRLLVNLLFAMHRTLEVSICAVLALIFHLLVAPTWIQEQGLRGLMFSTLGALSANLICILILVAFYVGFSGWKRVVSKYLQFAVLSLGICWSGTWYIPLKQSLQSGTAALALCMLGGGGIYFLFGRMWKAHELFDLHRLLKSR